MTASLFIVLPYYIIGSCELMAAARIFWLIFAVIADKANKANSVLSSYPTTRQQGGFFPNVVRRLN